MKLSVLLVSSCLILVSCKDASVDADSPKGITANTKIAAVASKAVTIVSTARLKAISSDNVNIDGTSSSWSYRYGKGESPDSYYYFTATETDVRLDSIGQGRDGDAYISGTWMNSVEAMKIAEGGGGMKFRGDNPKYVISAELIQAVIKDAAPTWHIMYKTPGFNWSGMIFTINAITGEFRVGAAMS